MNFSKLVICPGAQKSGTTWLHRALRKHPEFWMPPQKEVDYLFDFQPSREKYALRMGPKLTDPKVKAAIREWIALFLGPWDLANYPALFEAAGGKYSADISPNYSRMSADEIRRASAFLPGAKIVLILRDPVERAWSHAKNASKTWSISDPGAKLEKCSQFVHSAVCDLMSDYPRLVLNWSQAFGRERVAVVFYDELESNPKRFIDRVLAFAGANPFPGNLISHLHERHNTGESGAVPERVRASLISRYAPMLDDLRSLFKSMPIICGPKPRWMAGER